MPAAVDVVKVQSYDPIEPLVAPYVYAIGLTQERFPRKSRKTRVCLVMKIGLDLMTQRDSQAELQIASSENLKKNQAIQRYR